VEAINQIVVKAAERAGFTGKGLCSSDTTAQESPIAYPTEVGHMRNIAKKLVGMGKEIKKHLTKRLEDMAQEVERTFTTIRLFTRGKGEEAVAKKKKLSEGLQRVVARMRRFVQEGVRDFSGKGRERYQEALDFYGLMLSQIRQWMKTGFHPAGKIVSLWERPSDYAEQGGEGGGIWAAMDYHTIGERVCDRDALSETG